jgi:cell division protein FtsW
MSGLRLPAPNLRLGVDGWLSAASVLLLLFGLVMVASASIDFADRKMHAELFFFKRQLAFAGAALVLWSVMFVVPLALWQRSSFLLLGMALLLLVAVLAVGVTVNGSKRWLDLGFFRLQASEPARLAYLVWLADYLARHRERMATDWRIPARAVLLLVFMVFFFMKEPDFGASAILTVLALAMLFLAGLPLRYVIISVVVMTSLVVLAVWLEPYRLKRVVGYLDPFANKEVAQGVHYQLTNSLIAIGSGGWTGLGLGNSVQKLLYLPEMHTDFIFAILAEELGLAGVCVLLLLYGVVVVRGFRIAQSAETRGAIFNAYLVYGLVTWLALQVLLNMGVNMGLLPTKGLTLPLMSYGGSSLLTVALMIGLVLRADYENRLAASVRRKYR